jgi:aminoglycoside/choline kinase family phosphotransferase
MQASRADRADFTQAWNEVLDRLGAGGESLVLRDYHSPNIIWRPQETGMARLGLIDFQDALRGPMAYDLASLAQDARVDIPEDLERETVEAYCAVRRGESHFDETAFRREYAIMSLQRNSKILGIFVRLDQRDGKPAYLRHLPRIRDYARRSIRNEALSPLRERYEKWRLLGEEPR